MIRFNERPLLINFVDVASGRFSRWEKARMRADLVICPWHFVSSRS
jgi:hypothetical protein